MKTQARSILKKSMLLIRNDIWRYVAIFALAETMALLFMRQVSSRIFNLVLISAKIDGLNDQNFLSLFKNPIALLLLFVVLLLLASFVVIQLTALLAFADRSYHGEKLSFKSIFKPIIKMKFSHFLLLLLYIFIIMPLGNIGLTSTITANLRIPSFIIDHIEAVRWMSLVYYFVSLALFYINIRTFFAFIIFYNESIPFLSALKKSWTLTKNQSFAIIRLVLLIVLYTAIGIGITLAFTTAPLFIVERYAPAYVRIVNSFSSTIFLFVNTFIVSLSSIALVQSIVVFYHTLRGEEPLSQTKVYKPQKRGWALNIVVLTVFSLFSLFIYFDTPNQELLGEVFVVSHRGESRLAVENTLNSLRIANESKPDFVEMDVQELADGTLVIFHDSDLKRLAGYNRKISSYTYPELKDITISTHSNKDTIPTLDEYLALADSLDQKIMIEIKTNPEDSEFFLDSIMSSVRKHNMEDRVIYQSLDKKAILTYKERYPKAIVGYILGINIGGLESINVDFFSLEDFSLTTRVVRDAQRLKKGLFVWTVNEESLMEVYFKTDVSGIITDDIGLALKVREAMKETIVSDLFWNWNFGYR